MPFVLQIELSFVPGRKPRADNSDRVPVAFCVDDNSNTSPYLTDSNEPVFQAGMSLIENLQVVLTMLKQLPGYFERQTMLFVVRTVLIFVPFEFHV